MITRYKSIKDLSDRVNLICASSFTKESFDAEVDVQVGRMVTRGPQQINKATARLHLKQWLKKSGYTADQPGTIKDLSSDQRLNLILETEQRLFHGEQQWRQGMHRVLQATHPAWELVRVEPRKEPRPWPEIWAEAGGVEYPGENHAYPDAGRFIALKNSSIWTGISEFGLPYPPFRFNSGMGLRGVDLKTCQNLGLVRRREVVAV